MITTLPPSTTLRTASPAAGQDLARQLAGQLIGALPETTPHSMPDHLRTTAAARPPLEVVTAIYFHAIALANDGWRS